MAARIWNLISFDLALCFVFCWFFGCSFGRNEKKSRWYFCSTCCLLLLSPRYALLCWPFSMNERGAGQKQQLQQNSKKKTWEAWRDSREKNRINDGGGGRRGKAKCNETGFHIVCSTVLWPWRKRNGGDTQNRTRNFYTGQQTVWEGVWVRGVR